MRSEFTLLSGLLILSLLFFLAKSEENEKEEESSEEKEADDSSGELEDRQIFRGFVIVYRPISISRIWNE